MRRATIRFGNATWMLLEREAELDGVSVAQWVREAAIARAVWVRAMRGEPIEAAMRGVYERICADREAPLVDECGRNGALG